MAYSKCLVGHLTWIKSNYGRHGLMSIARKQAGEEKPFRLHGRGGEGIKINSASRADREWAEWNESQKWMTRWGRLTFCSFSILIRENWFAEKGIRYRFSFRRPKKSFKTLKFDILQGQILVWQHLRHEERTIHSRRKYHALNWEGGSWGRCPS